MSIRPGRAVVVGGGVIGTACAYYLTKAGWSVTVIERGAMGGGSSGGNCGLVCPSHVLPLAEPGAIGGALKSIFRKNSPFKIRARLDPALWSWLLHFARRCNHRDMMASGRGIQALLESSLELYREVVDRESLECEWQTRGLLFAYRTREAMDAYAPTDRLLKDEFHCPATRYDGDDVAALEPALKPGLAGGWYYEDDAHLRPDKLLSSWRRMLASAGVTFVEDCGLRGFDRTHGHARAVDTTTGPIAADLFVVATGALTPLLNEHLGCTIPIQPGKGYSLTMPRPADRPVHPL